MRESKTKETRYVRYTHRERPDIEYDVESSYPYGGPVPYVFNGESCYQVRTIRNVSFAEEVHQSERTMMPSRHFFDFYEPVEG